MFCPVHRLKFRQKSGNAIVSKAIIHHKPFDDDYAK